MMLFLWLLFLSDKESLTIRAQGVAAMGLNKPFAGFTRKTSNILTHGDITLSPLQAVSSVDAHTPRYSIGTASAPTRSGFDGQHLWESETIKELASKKAPLSSEMQQLRGQHEWWLFLPILLTDQRLQPLPYTDPDGRVGIRFLNPNDKTLLADVFLVDGLPAEVHFYSPPNLDTGKQRITTSVFSDYRTVNGRTLPYHIIVEDSAAKEKAIPIGLTVEVEAWIFHDKIDPAWFTPPK